MIDKVPANTVSQRQSELHMMKISVYKTYHGYLYEIRGLQKAKVYSNEKYWTVEVDCISSARLSMLVELVQVRERNL